MPIMMWLVSKWASKDQGDSESCQKQFPNTTSEISYINRHIIPQKNWHPSLDRWLKGFGHTVTYSQDISCPNHNTNCWTPCSLPVVASPPLHTLLTNHEKQNEQSRRSRRHCTGIRTHPGPLCAINWHPGGHWPPGSQYVLSLDAKFKF